MNIEKQTKTILSLAIIFSLCAFQVISFTHFSLAEDELLTESPIIEETPLDTPTTEATIETPLEPLEETTTTTIETPVEPPEETTTTTIITEESQDIPTITESVLPVQEQTPVSNPQQQPELSTDKADYAPGETVSIFGRFFQSLQNIVLKIFGGSVEENNYTESTNNVTTDEQGSFVSQYLLDNIFRPIYTIIANTLTGEELARTTFTDTALPSSVKLQQWETRPSGKWITGALGSSNSDYSEGETVPFRIDAGTRPTSGNPYTFSVCRDYENGTKKGYISLQPFDTSRSATPGGTISETSGPFSGVNISGISFTEVGGQGACGTGERETQVSFNVISSSVDIYILWGGRLASPADLGVGAGNGAASYQGASLHMKLLFPNKDVSISPAAIIELATVTVQKIVDSGSATPDQWCFNISPNPNIETLPKCPTSGSDTVTFLDLSTGSYQITETSVAGYSFASGTGTNCTFTGSTSTASVTSAVNAINATCVFHNSFDDIAPKLTLVKTVTNDNGGTAVVADFPLFINGDSVTSGGKNTLSANVLYTATETTKTGYAASVWSGNCTENGTITLQPGDDKTCTITNDDIQPKLHVIKHVINDDGGLLKAKDFDITVTGQSPNPATFDGAEDPGALVMLNQGSYSVDETAVSGYTKTLSADCSGSIAVGQENACTITNDDQPGTLIVIKHVINDNLGTKTASDFSITVTGTNVKPSATFLGAESPGTTVTLNAGSYSVDETAVFGYAKSLSADCSGSIANDETKTCTITNDDIQPKLHVVKHVINDNGGNAVAGDFTMNVTGSSPSPVSFPGIENSGTLVMLNAGAYSVDENVFSGYAKSLSANCSTNISVGEEKTCTITNDDIVPTITLIKAVNNDHGGNAIPADFTLKIDNQGVAQNIVIPVTSNADHSIDEVLISGYQFVSITGTGCPTQLGGTVNLNEGENIACTITNEDLPAKITLVKEVTNDNGGTAGLNDFGILINGNVVTSGVANEVNSNTNHAINEAGLTGYQFVSITGANCPQSLGGTVTLNEGQEITCTITNDDIQPKLHVIKHVINDNGGTKNAADFSITVTGSNPSPATFVGSESGTLVVLNAGSYGVDEAVVTGYAKTLTIDCAGTLLVGDEKTCTITNNDIQPKLTVTKVVTNDNGGTKVIADFPLFVDATSVTSGAQNGFDADTYIVSETQQTGYAATISGDCDPTTGSVTLSVGDVKACTITNDDIPAKLTIVKDADPNDCQDFQFTGTNPIGSFSLDDDSGVTECLDTNQSQSKTLSNLSANTPYTVTEAIPNTFWKFNGVTCVVTGTQIPYTFASVTNGLTITLNLADDVTCTFANEKLSPTRTLGFWKTHTSFTTTILNTKFTVNPLFIGQNVVPGIGTHKGKITTAQQLFGAYYSNNAKTSTGAKRSPIDQARIQLLHQLLTAKLNCAAFGCQSSVQSLISQADAAYAAGTDKNLILSLAGQIDVYNNSGDTIIIAPYVQGKATPKDSQSIADIVFWNLP